MKVLNYALFVLHIIFKSFLPLIIVLIAVYVGRAAGWEAFAK